MNRKLIFLFAVLCAVFLDIPAESDLIFYWRKAGEGKCEPFKTYMVDCNRCICGADETPYCTKMACLTQDFMQKLAQKRFQHNLGRNHDEDILDEKD